jgi:hypothetical protein
LAASHFGLAIASARYDGVPWPGEPPMPNPRELCSNPSRVVKFTAPAVAKSPWFAKYGPLLISTRSIVSGMMKFVSENPCPWACDTMLMGMPSMERATSVP